MPSPWLLPVSVAVLKATPDGAAGALLSITTLKAPDWPLLTPPLLTTAVMACAPELRPDTKL